MDFYLYLFGKTIAQFGQCLQALHLLGLAGIGKAHARYQICRVEDQKGNCIVDRGQVCLENFEVSTVSAYALNRFQTISTHAVPLKNELVFHTPAALKYHGSLLTRFDSDALIRTVLRRIYCFDCFEGIETEPPKWECRLPEIRSQKPRQMEIRRYSTRKDERVPLRGITGTVAFDELPDELLLLFAAGEILHIGKNTSFGFGRYRIR
ncbi:MAG: CRISPR system precrRNA processing endoribonuclease RAMP protein Cas6 [Lachnospiraceae bacterium]|nr:CRISPR system precrRNA processing endoribonuclease RAMP protein Cas6 [Lachnospiraceae bacterium]